MKKLLYFLRNYRLRDTSKQICPHCGASLDLKMKDEKIYYCKKCGLCSYDAFRFKAHFTDRSEKY